MHIHEPFKSGQRPATLFERRARQLCMVGSVVIGLTAIIAFLFSRSLLRSIRQFIQGTRELAKGNRNKATLAVARKLVAHMLAVDKNKRTFQMPLFV